MNEDATKNYEVYAIRQLLSSILNRALDDLGFQVTRKDDVPASRHEALQAQRWIVSNSEKPFSFLWICQQLDLCPYTVREKLYEHIRNKNLGIYYPDSVKLGLDFSTSEQLEMFNLVPGGIHTGVRNRITRVSKKNRAI